MNKIVEGIKGFFFRSSGRGGSTRPRISVGKGVGEAVISIPDGGEPPDEHEMRMIKAILHLERTYAREIMVPRVDIVAVEVNEPVSEAVARMLEAGHGRLPVYEETIDKLVGIVYAQDLLRFVNREVADTRLRDLARPILFIPESKRLNDLLQEFQQRRVQISIVVDEYGGTSGLVTIEDLLEEIVGELEDEFAQGEPQMEVISEGELLVDGRVSINQMSELLSVSLHGDDYDTVGGFLYSRLGKIPAPGDEITIDGLSIRVVSTSGRRIRKVRIQKIAT